MFDRPHSDEYGEFFAGYLAAVPEGDILARLAAQPSRLTRIAETAGEARELWRYAPGKWSPRQIFGHLIDGERIFGYRAFRIGSGDATPLASFDQDPYVEIGGYDEIPLAESAAEFELVRRANLVAVERLGRAAAERRGVAGGAPLSYRAMLFVMAGHVEHHLKILAESYGLVG